MATKQLGPEYVHLKNVRGSFLHLYEAVESVKDGPKKFRANLLIDPKTEDGKANLKRIANAIRHVELEKFGKSDIVYKEGRCSFQNGDDKISSKTDEVYEGYEGMKVVVASSDRRISVVDRDMTPLAAEDGKPYSGCYLNALVHFYAIKDKDKGGNGLFVDLDTVQFYKDGEPFGGAKVNAEDVFTAIEEEDEEEEAPKPVKKKASARDLM